MKLIITYMCKHMHSNMCISILQCSKFSHIMTMNKMLPSSDFLVYIALSSVICNCVLTRTQAL